MNWTELATRIRAFFTSDFFSLKTTEELERLRSLPDEVKRLQERIRRTEECGLTPATKLFIVKREEEIYFANHLHDRISKLFAANGLTNCAQYPHVTETRITSNWPDTFKITLGWVGSANKYGVGCGFTAEMAGGDRWRLEYYALGDGIDLSRKMEEPVSFEVLLRTPLDIWFKTYVLGSFAFDPKTGRSNGPTPVETPAVVYPPLATPTQAALPTDLKDVSGVPATPEPLSNAEELYKLNLEEATQGLKSLGYDKARIKRMLKASSMGDSAEDIIKKALTLAPQRVTNN